MRNRSQKYEARTLPLLIVLLTFLLPGCRPATAQQEAQPASAEAVANGDADKGRALFMGYTHFHNAGPPCMGCHSVGQNGILGGGALGPNLTNVSTQREDAAIVGFLSGSGTETSPVMQPIYADHPLTEQEQADLLAFMKSSAGQPEADMELPVLGLSMLGTVGAAGVLGFVYRNRLRRVRKALVDQAQKELL